MNRPPHPRHPPHARRTSIAPQRSLQDLSAMAGLLRAQRERAEQLALEQALALARRERERNLFALSVGRVTALRERNAAYLPTPTPEPLPMQHVLDEQRVLREAMSDEFDVSTLLDTDDQLSFRRPGIGLDVAHKLRGGYWSIQRQLDLHGLRVDEAREALGQFIRHAHRNGLRCVRIVHGKGLGSPGRTPVLKSRVHRWLVQKNEVLAFVQARPLDGGAGALVVLLQPVREARPSVPPDCDSWG